MGKAFRELKNKAGKKSDNETAVGKGRLPDRVIDKIQNYYGYAIRGSNDKDSMKTKVGKVVWQLVGKPCSMFW